MLSLATLHLATAQEIFNQVVTPLRTQNKQSRVMNGWCVYRTDDGLSCAGGCLISDDEYRQIGEMIEDRRWADAVLAVQELFPKADAHHELIRQLQIVHDSVLPTSWEEELSSTAADFNLTMPDLTTSLT